MINPANDVYVWGCALLVIVLMAVRAWTVETGTVRLGRTPTRVRALTAAVVVALVALVVLTAVQGGALFVHSVLTHTDPSKIPNVVLPANPAPAPAPAAPGAGAG